MVQGSLKCLVFASKQGYIHKDLIPEFFGLFYKRGRDLFSVLAIRYSVSNLFVYNQWRRKQSKSLPNARLSHQNNEVCSIAMDSSVVLLFYHHTTAVLFHHIQNRRPPGELLCKEC